MILLNLDGFIFLLTETTFSIILLEIIIFFFTNLFLSKSGIKAFLIKIDILIKARLLLSQFKNKLHNGYLKFKIKYI